MFPQGRQTAEVYAMTEESTDQDIFPGSKKLWSELAGVALFFLALFLGLSLATYSVHDPGFNHQLSASHSIHNRAGVVGAYLSGLLADIFGIGAWLFPPLALWGGLRMFFPRLRLTWHRWVGILLVLLCVAGWAATPQGRQSAALGDISGGGLVGTVLFDAGTAYLHRTGSFLIWLFFLIAGLQLTLNISWMESVTRLLGRALDFWRSLGPSPDRERAPSGEKSRKGKPGKDAKETSERLEDDLAALFPANPQQGKKGQGKTERKAPSKSAGSTASGASGAPDPSAHSYPPGELLQPAPRERTAAQQENLEELSKKLSDCLLEFGIQGEVVNALPGPVVTMFEFRPAPGVKISRIANLHDDLALALKARAVRIEAPIPGKDIVGVEIPNENRQTVYFRNVVESSAFASTRLNLPMALGEDIQGGPRVEDLSRMPHLLVAGATGAGKSVCLNSIIISLLYKASPQEMKLLLIDPKRIEMASFADLPHLVHPVVTEMELAKTALDWAVHEMEQRYEAMAAMSVRNIEGYNKKVQKLRESQEEGQEANYQPMPYLVLIIDELADLMLTVGKEAEASIVRLAQLARAAGIHLILATQRPSVDVVTGLIKANFPARIAFQVSSKHDSRTILDSGGAEYLLGKGDMLFKSSAGSLERIHGAFLSDEEITAVIDFWKSKVTPAQEVDLKEWQKEAKQNGQSGGDDISEDPLYDQAVEFVTNQGKASISMIQRQLRIGFNRAARFVEQMERDGVIGPQEGSKPRTVIK
jgi:S-DNA-T family DNA segregation ATPase FtsK/SpoIIIE